MVRCDIRQQNVLIEEYQVISIGANNSDHVARASMKIGFFEVEKNYGL